MSSDVNNNSILSYKALDISFKCRDVQFEVGKIYTTDGSPVLCKSGYHSCLVPTNVLIYYTDINNNRYALIENIGEIVKGDNKMVCNKIKIIKEISRHEYESISGCFIDEKNELNILFGKAETKDEIERIISLIPKETKHIVLHTINETICELILANITSLSFGHDFNQPLSKLPESLTSLRFGYFFNHPLPKLPESLTSLSFGYCFNQPLPEKLPEGLIIY